MIWGRKQPSEACCPHGVPRETQCMKCTVEAHRGQVDSKLEEQRLELIEGEKAEGDLEYGWQIKKGEKRDELFERGQDMVLVDEKRKLTAVFDGMGGEGSKDDPDSGARASSVAAEFLPEFYDKAMESVKARATREDVMEMLKEQIRIPENNPQYATMLAAAEKAFFALPKEVQMTMLALNRSIKDLNPLVLASRGKTTITAGVTVEMPGGQTMEVIAQIGDSGVVKVGEDGSVKDVAPEDTLLDDLVESGEITPEQAKDPDFVYQGKYAEVLKQKFTKEATIQNIKEALGDKFITQMVATGEITPAQAKDPYFTYRGEQAKTIIPKLGYKDPTIKRIGTIATQALGEENKVRPRMLVEKTLPGDGYYFMTDGQRDVIRDKKGDLDLQKIGQVVGKSKNPKEACANLNAEAAKMDKKFDDKGIVAKVRRLEEISPDAAEEIEDIEEISPDEVEEVAA